MSIKEFLNNNNFVLSIISQYVGAEHLKNMFTNEVLKEYKEILIEYSLGINLQRLKYFNITKSYYDVRGDNIFYDLYLTSKNKLYSKLGYASLNQFCYNLNCNYLMRFGVSYDNMPPSIITQLNYFD